MHVEPLIQNCKGNMDGFMDWKGLIQYIEHTKLIHNYQHTLTQDLYEKILVCVSMLLPYFSKSHQFSQLLDF